MAVFTVVERLRWGVVGGGWTGWTGTTLQGSCTMELNGLASNAIDLGEASSCHGRYRVRNKPCTLALRRTPSARPGQLSLDAERMHQTGWC